MENSNNVKGYLTFSAFSSLRKDTEGIWIKYKGRDNSESLQKLFKEKSIDFRKIDFKNDNIYIYYTKDDKEIELKEDIDEGIDYNEAKKKEELVLNENELENSYIEAEESDDENSIELSEDNDSLFEEDGILDDEDIYENDLSEDNLDEDKN